MTADVDLTADCARCFGLCCVLLPFTADAGFGVDKPGGTPCLNLLDDDRCRIHATLRADGWPGCTVFDCFGAGQQVSQVTYAGRSWRDGVNRGEMAAVFTVVRLLHEALAHLGEAVARTGDADLAALRARIVDQAGGAPDDLLALDVDAVLCEVGDRLREASRVVRSGHGDGPHQGGDLAGADLRGAVLRAADLRGALLVGADLRGVDLTDTDLLGADLRGADVRGADLSASLFLAQAQLNAATGDVRTRIPERLGRPAHWTD
ncbi:pentapeptide repeat-containing protein [Nocardioides terrisoli]|uniref:pentapeptide repeat-containing protein n=1 Tax=Nocardioides terrisoli TaxID=3388267 RepID=UPI00287B7005|nr:pentapeptide repeat-containing protein [Nocardioides marmorisolisilvae]